MTLCFWLALLSLFGASGAVHIVEPTATVANGTYVGVTNNNYHVDYFLGMPFAEPPIGQRRLRPPQSINETWTGSRNATEYVYACHGYGDDTEIAAQDYVNEDCLTLNVIRPSGTTKDSNLPVLVWIHGGGFFAGAAMDQRYNLTFVVQHSVRIGKPLIAISLNYRLASYGFLYSPEILEAGVANLGLKDQRGAISVGLQLRAYNGRNDDIFQGAIAASGSLVGLGIGASTPFDLAQKVYQNFTESLNCSNTLDTLKCLRDVAPQQFNEATKASLDLAPLGYLAYQPFIDGDFIAESGISQMEKSNFVKVPLMTGTNSDEGTSFAPFGINDDSELVSFLASLQLSVKSQSELLRLYSSDSGDLILGDKIPLSRTIGLQWRRVASIIGDLMFIGPRFLSDRIWVNQTDIPLYNYRFNAVPYGVSAEYSASHFMEIPFFLRNFEGTGFLNIGGPYLGPNPFNGLPETAYRLSDLMSGMLISFVNNGSPNHLPNAPQHEKGQEDSANLLGRATQWLILNTEPMDEQYVQGPLVEWPPFTTEEQRQMVFQYKEPMRVEHDELRLKQLVYISLQYMKGEGPWNMRGQH